MYRFARQNTFLLVGLLRVEIVLCVFGLASCVHTDEPVVLDISEGPLAAEVDQFDAVAEDTEPTSGPGADSAVSDPSVDSTAAESSAPAKSMPVSPAPPVREADKLIEELNDEISRMESLVGNNVADKALVAPVIFALKAQIAELTASNVSGSAANNASNPVASNPAVEFWRQALVSSPSDGRLAKLVFESWARFLIRDAKDGTDALQLASSGLAALGDCRNCQYLVSEGLLTPNELARRLHQLMPDRLSFVESAATTGGDLTFPPRVPPSFGAKNPVDPLLAGLIKQACAAKTPGQIGAWKKWSESIPVPWRGLWNGSIAACSDQHQSAVTSFAETIDWLNSASARGRMTRAEEAALRLDVVWRSIRSKRAMGDRESLGPDYSKLMAAWQDPALSPATTGMNPASFTLRKINDTAWAARQKSLLGDLQGAEDLARSALQLINRSFPDPAFARSNYRKELADLRCEVLHFLAFRVAYERREWTQAANLTDDALATIPLSPDWSRKLQMHSVIYDFLGGQMTLARKRIESLLADPGARRSRAFGLFWLARVLAQLGQKTESDFYLKALLTEEPLSYYAVVAAPGAGLLAPDAWVNRLGNLEELRGRLGAVSLAKSQDVLRIVDFKGKKHEWESRRRRAELLIRAKAPGVWARASVADALSAARQVARPDRHPELFLYLSRLAYGAGDYWRAIQLTTQLSEVVENFWERYPEQLFVIYPFPKIQNFKNAANKKSRLTLMLGVARQESSFRPEVRSPAGAYGYMQLTPATARRLLAEQAPADDEAVEALLLDPQSSIRLSAVYLEKLETQFAGSELLVAAAYNAGEFAVAGWQKNRQVEDMALFVEGIPYGETQGYVKSVLRNAAVYRQLLPLTLEGLAGIKKDQ